MYSFFISWHIHFKNFHKLITIMHTEDSRNEQQYFFPFSSSYNECYSLLLTYAKSFSDVLLICTKKFGTEEKYSNIIFSFWYIPSKTKTRKWFSYFYFNSDYVIIIKKILWFLTLFISCFLIKKNSYA